MTKLWNSFSLLTCKKKSMVTHIFKGTPIFYFKPNTSHLLYKEV